MAPSGLGQLTPEQAGPSALDLHKGIRDPQASACRRWPEHLRLLNQTTGELLPGRCRATNLCRYCQTLYVVETVEMLTLDAMENAPTLWVVLTAREHLTRAQCTDHLRQLRKAARKLWPDCEWFIQVEFQRRGALHLNLLVKGVPASDCERFKRTLVRVWCKRVDALPAGQWCDTVQDGYGVTRYISKMLAHGLKKEQAPPIGWRGHRTSQTRGYLVRPASVMRQEARQALRLKRLLWKGHDLETAELELAAAQLVKWSVRWVNPSTVGARALSRSGQGNESPRVLVVHPLAQVDRAPSPAAVRGPRATPGVAPHGAPPVARAFTPDTDLGGS